ncbi:CsgG/HfaB family protein [Francisella adeliensis]|uniref:Penicillin-binding protein activator LpoB n=1 Tax=Francisella adeliensis TaxID=2007306 RepID=A0A2Z4XX85_9GAMM|nr:CsgG/HfaB family protein [Francisella adeliensis]AXA33349.1 penicillin-binding protein activator LpoB [Francisella adeliensis]MBK2085361.1 penicillin-binding protein activator LpoB [Francisella adeliensis]MBK2097091.1 penicillin-binding protein activator LpoB [Francisella adeliensis]QIW11577.1 penicillin-binding protein activator LpoB [Francisella adeliensis]QIW13452.1 penicillin-binding protein activator LpoB [Francisella adeliensis]
MKKIITLSIAALLSLTGGFADTTNKAQLNSGSTYKSVDERDKLEMFSIAIQPFEVDESKLPKDTNAKVFQRGLNQAIVAEFTQSRKFRVASRDDTDDKAYQKEIEKIINSDSKDDRTKLNKKIGADFILTGNVLSVNSHQKKTSYYGEHFTTWSVSATVAYRVLELATMEVKWSNVVKVNVPTNVANETMQSNDGQFSAIATYLDEQIGSRIADEVIGAIYPLQVLKVIDGEIYFNQGGNRVKEGSIYEVRQSGGTTVDEATGQHVVLDAKVLAKVRITDVMPKYSIGIVVDGSLSKIQKGARSYLVK